MENIFKLVNEGRFLEALESIDKLPEIDQERGRIIIAKADSKYELGRDLEALQEYVYYFKKYPSGYGRNFALIGIVVCLKNIDMQDEAREFIELIDDSHDGKRKELEHSLEIISKQNAAKIIISGISGSAGINRLEIENERVAEKT